MCDEVLLGCDLCTEKHCGNANMSEPNHMYHTCRLNIVNQNTPTAMGVATYNNFYPQLQYGWAGTHLPYHTKSHDNIRKHK